MDLFDLVEEFFTVRLLNEAMHHPDSAAGSFVSFLQSRRQGVEVLIPLLDFESQQINFVVQRFEREEPQPSVLLDLARVRMGDEVILQRFSVSVEQWIVPQKTKNSQAACRLGCGGKASKPQLYSFVPSFGVIVTLTNFRSYVK